MGKKERMERDPSIDPVTGRKRERRLKDDGDKTNPGSDFDRSGFGTRIHIDGVDMSSSIADQIKHLSPEMIKRAEEAMRAAAEKAEARFHDPISIEGRADMGGRNIRSSDMMGAIFGTANEMFGRAFVDTDEMRRIAGLPPLGGIRGVMKVQRHLWMTAMDIWDYPSGVRISVWRQEEQASTLITVEYMDPEQEVDEALVKGTLEFTDEALEGATGGPELMVQKKLEQLKENCDADMAAFEPDPNEGDV